MTTHATYPDLDGTVTEWGPDRPVGEVPPNVPVTPRTTLTAWICCFCVDGSHPEREFAQRQTWVDGGYTITPAWHLDRAGAVADHTFAHGDRHIVARDMHITTATTVIEVAR